MFSSGQRLALDTAHLGAVADDMWIQGLKDSEINKDQSRTIEFNPNIVDSIKRGRGGQHQQEASVQTSPARVLA